MDDRVDALARRAEGRQVRGVQRNKALVGRQRQRRSVRHDETVDADAPGLGARAGVLGGVGGGDVDGVHVGQPQLRYGRPRVKLAAVARGGVAGVGRECSSPGTCLPTRCVGCGRRSPPRP